jgi:hypothetical protein
LSAVWPGTLRVGLVCATAATALLAVFALDRHMVILLMILFGASMGALLTPLCTLGVTQAPEDEPGSLPGISNAAFGIGGGLGFAWAGTVVGEGTGASYHSVLWMRRHRHRRPCDQPDPQAESSHRFRAQPLIANCSTDRVRVDVTGGYSLVLDAGSHEHRDGRARCD